ncbi:MDR family MFS transporter [Lentilactobacillus hilgardii]|jgi:MFS family permease|uniref:MFS transporter n=1 Tax=Lentilactobacillus hilgardii TaxID=1588 RepID=A0A6P1E6N1_LENHI|nr:transporter, major facilitator family protein [Lentilactobacillus hilgardii ATCC 27305]MCT3392592.1 MFS transporter [Lentilactobacillus hilgardii]QHB53046.1 MFS transporter [Lentilactobacillus hilgardii]RRG08613.1 MAG: MFS transporter [Lactobacillus sp.]
MGEEIFISTEGRDNVPKRSEIRFSSVILYSLILNAGAAFMWPLVTVYMHNYLHKSLTLAGMTILVMSVFMMIGNYLGGYLFDRWSPYKAAIISVVISMSAIIGLVFFHGWPMFSILLLFVGFGDGACMTLLNSYAASIKTRSTRAIFNVLYIGQNVGIVIGTLMVGFLLSHGVTTVFIVAAIFYFILLVITLIDFNVVVQRRAPGKKIQPGAPHETNVGSMILAICGVVLGVYLSYALWESVISVHMTNLHIPFENYSLLWTLNGLMIVFGQPFVNRIGEHFKLSTQTYIGVFIFAISFIGLIFAKQYYAFIIVMVVTTIGEMIGFPGIPAWIDSLSTPQQRGKFQGMYNLFMSFGRALGPLIGGVFLDFAPYGVLFSFAAGIIIVFLVILMILNHRRNRINQQFN